MTKTTPYVAAAKIVVRAVLPELEGECIIVQHGIARSCESREQRLYTCDMSAMQVSVWLYTCDMNANIADQTQWLPSLFSKTMHTRAQLGAVPVARSK